MAEGSDESERIRSGDRVAFAEMVSRYQRRVRLWLAMHCPPGGDVDDIAQRTFLAAYLRIDEFRPGSNFEAWLFAIARYQLRTEMTSLRRQADYRSRFGHDLLALELERRAGLVDERIEDRLRHLESCLAQASEADRQMLDGRYREQAPLDALAARTGRSVAAVKKWLWTLRIKIRECIEAKAQAEMQA